jgi:hypothetical protein
MGGVGATAFSLSYPQIVLAESSFAGRSIIRYLWSLSGNELDKDKFAGAYGYDSFVALTSDKFSHVVGLFPELSLTKYQNGSADFAPDRESDYSNWLAYFAQIGNLSRDSDPGIWVGKRTVPYKAWNSWADRVADTKLEEVLQSAYNRGNACPYYIVEYETGTHTNISHGQINDMIPQLIEWYRRWE